MPEPFVFHFKPGPRGRVEAMYILDLDCQCGLCRHDQFQRFYHSTPFHELTVPTLEKLADGAALKAGYECENCGEAVGADQVRHSRLTFGFADDAGVIRIFDDYDSGTRSYECSPRRRLDPQVVPRWSADPDALGDDHRVVDRFDEAIIERIFDRPLNVKLAWRDLLNEQLDGEKLGRWTRISPGIWAVVAGDRRSGTEISEAIDDTDFRRARARDELLSVTIDDGVPDQLPTHENPENLDGRWKTWLPDHVIDRVDAGDLEVVAHVDKKPAIETITRAFEVGRLDYEYDETDEVFSNLTTPTETVYDRPLTVESVVRRAVYTGLTPGEAGRLTAEEIIGTLMQVW